jgi:hypothetical protein
MSYASFLSDKIATRERGEWLMELYIKNPSGVEVILRFSMRGTGTGADAVTIGSDTIAAHTPFRKRLISIPEFTQSLWQSGKILSSSIPSYGSAKLTNMDGGLDQYNPNLSWQWSGCRVKIFHCDYLNLSSTIGKVIDGYIGVVDFSLPEVSISLKGREDLFSVPINDRVYRGTSYMLELFGDRTVSYGTPAAVNLTGNMTMESWEWIDAAQTTAQFTQWGWNGGTANPWRMGFTSSNTIRLFAHIAGIQETVTSVATVPIQGFFHWAAVITGRDVRFEIFNEDTQTLTIETQVNAFSSATRNSNVGGTYVLRSGNDATFRPWHDEIRVWNYARSSVEIAADRFRPLVTVPVTCVHRTGMDDGTGTTVTDSSASAAHGTISGAGTSSWLWANEGTAELAGSPKIDTWGERWGVKPVMVDPVRQGYQVAGGGAISDVTTYEGGLSHTMDASAANYRTYLTTTPAAGHSLRYLPRGLFKLGSSPTLPISALVKGYNGGALGYVNTSGSIARDVVTRRGPKLVDPTDLNTTSFTNYITANPGIVGKVIYTSTLMSTVLDDLMKSGAGFWGYIGSSTLFYLKKYSGPAVTADYNFTQKNTVAISPLPPLAVVYEVIVKYRHNDVVHTEDQVAASIKSTTNWTPWTQEWQEQKRSDAAIRTAFPGSSSISVTFETDLQYSYDAGWLADYLIALLKGPKLAWGITVTNAGLQVTIDQTATESVILQQGGSTRLGLDGTRKYSILTVNYNPSDGTVRQDIWG